MPTEQPPLVGEVSANVCGEMVSRGQRDESLPEPLLFFPNSSSVVLTRLSGPRSRPQYFSENLVAPEIEPGSLDL
jgi:hypothetical protein